MVKNGAKSPEFIVNFATVQSAEEQAVILFDVVLAREGDPAGLITWAEQIRLNGWDGAVDAILNSEEYLQTNGNTDVPGNGRDGCGVLSPSGTSPTIVEQFYCRVLSRPFEDDAFLLEWIDYLETNTVKDLVRAGATSTEFIAKYVTGQSPEDQAVTLFDVLLAREGGPDGLATFTNFIRDEGWTNAVDE
jgi:hypothetical protein